jgi:hypothetical protein
MGGGGSKGSIGIYNTDPDNTAAIKEDPIKNRFQDYENPIQFNIDTKSDNRYIVILIIIFFFTLLILKSLLFTKRKK